MSRFELTKSALMSACELLAQHPLVGHARRDLTELPARRGDATLCHMSMSPLTLNIACTTTTLMSTRSDFLAAKRSMSARYLKKASASTVTRFGLVADVQPKINVVGVGVGTKFTAGKETGTQCVRFYVVDKIHKEALGKKDLLPTEVDGLPTDVIVTGRFRLFNSASDNKKKHRPVRPGTSIGFKFPPPSGFVMAGTFGAVVARGSQRFILSNNHVLTENGQIALGSLIFQPGLLDGGNAATDSVAVLTKFIKIKGTGTNKVDCAIAKFLPTTTVNPVHMPSVGALASAAPIAAAVGMKVMKTGRTTGHTTGVVFDILADVNIEYEDAAGNPFVATFVDQVIVTPGGFSASGDSGSLIVDRASRRATGLLFAGSASHTIGNHIKDVLNALGVTLVIA